MGAWVFALITASAAHGLPSNRSLQPARVPLAGPRVVMHKERTVSGLLWQ